MFLCRNLMKLNGLCGILNAGRAALGCRSSTGDASYSSSSKDYIVMTDNGSTIVCWHPEREVHYEHTKPLPVIEPKIREGDSVLKLQVRVDSLNRGYKNERIEVEELCKLTYTTKHRWYPHNDEKYKDPNPPVDREGL